MGLKAPSLSLCMSLQDVRGELEAGAGKLAGQLCLVAPPAMPPRVRIAGLATGTALNAVRCFACRGHRLSGHTRSKGSADFIWHDDIIPLEGLFVPVITDRAVSYTGHAGGTRRHRGGCRWGGVDTPLPFVLAAKIEGAAHLRA